MTDREMFKKAERDYVNTYLEYSDVSWFNIFKKLNLKFKMLGLESMLDDDMRRM